MEFCGPEQAWIARARIEHRRSAEQTSDAKHTTHRIEMTTAKSTDSWLAGLAPPLRQIAESLRHLIIQACPSLTESIKWGNPVYEQDGKVCYLAAGKGYISLGFFNGAALSDPEGIIEGTGKRMRHVKFRELSEISQARLASWLRQAVELNQRE